MPTTQRILLVDDDAALRATLRTCLEAVGYQCVEAQDGSDAQDWLKKGYAVDLIVTDHHMPRVNGMDLIKELKIQAHTESIPIIFYSGNLSHELKIQAIQAGSHAVIAKPFSLESFLALVSQACGKTIK
ncbi:MAG: response regulator [Nitrospirota bacterium]|nr:response regulator [Nitrospirota bacterium]MDH5586432.1 response regulator [Nitrospirota bacterium]MDH5775087.1 response regulator [Nitrospirota bacterium]